LKHKGKFNGEISDGKGKRPMKKQRREEMNQGEEMEEENDDEHIIFALNKPLTSLQKPFCTQNIINIHLKWV
jgi:hypothetical protein